MNDKIYTELTRDDVLKAIYKLIVETKYNKKMDKCAYYPNDLKDVLAQVKDINNYKLIIKKSNIKDRYHLLSDDIKYCAINMDEIVNSNKTLNAIIFDAISQNNKVQIGDRKVVMLTKSETKTFKKSVDTLFTINKDGAMVVSNDDPLATLICKDKADRTLMI